MLELVLPILVGVVAALALLPVRRLWGARFILLDRRPRLSRPRYGLGEAARRVARGLGAPIRLLGRGSLRLMRVPAAGLRTLRSRAARNLERRRAQRARETVRPVALHAALPRVSRETGAPGRDPWAAQLPQSGQVGLGRAAPALPRSKKEPLLHLSLRGRPLIAVGPGKPRTLAATAPEWRESQAAENNTGWWRHGGEDCPECGPARERGARYCIRCGRPLDRSLTPSA
jgi:hypothetical protein